MKIKFQTISPVMGNQCGFCLEEYTDVQKNQEIWVKAHNNTNNSKAEQHPFHKSCIEALVKSKPLKDRIICSVCKEEIRPATPINELKTKYQILSKLSDTIMIVSGCAAAVLAYSSLRIFYEYNLLINPHSAGLIQTTRENIAQYFNYGLKSILAGTSTTLTTIGLDTYLKSLCMRIASLQQLPPQNYFD